MALDIHGGGPHLKFPHHENEIAQSEGAFGGQMAHYWMHCGPLMVDADKMSKSLGNFLRIRDTVAKKVNGQDDQADYQANIREAEMLRFFIVRNHYRSTQNFSPKNLNDAQLAIDRLYQCLANVPVAEPLAEIDWSHPQAAQFKDYMNDDFNTAGAVSVLFEMANEINRKKDAQLSALLKALGGVLGLLTHEPPLYLKTASRYGQQEERVGGSQSPSLTNEEIQHLINERSRAKETKDFETADKIRDNLRAQGIELEDKAGGETQWRRV